MRPPPCRPARTRARSPARRALYPASRRSPPRRLPRAAAPASAAPPATPSAPPPTARRPAATTPPSKLRGCNLHVPIDCSCKSFTC
ncbi:hypothetical protein GQ55_9G260900 [Panicum hallii var. hallii]|uniref:Uncharacterized protein n=1 Tax=Panicum hallii var. hallii TaxID=1504633 RepID=A0A2T7C712_9POAL|nr:hypothetical protein GQ55_9G260900 [Panicum hallii var. hallii]